MRILLAMAAAVAVAAVPYTYVPLPDPSALCLDGSQYGISVCMGSSDNSSWEIGFQGGGWCYDEADCWNRASTPLGSSTTWPATVAKTTTCYPNAGVNAVNLWYCDGASFTGYREEGWPMPYNASQKLMFRGIRNLDASLDLLIDKYGLDQAKQVVVTGGSAGGLSTFLHLDHVAERVAAVAPAARVVGQPVCGFFLDHGNGGFAPFNQTYTQQMAYVYNMQNSSGSLSTECQTALQPAPWQCIMAPHAAPFVKTPWFALQSRFDHWQLSEILFLPCMQAEPYAPPFKPNTCTPAEIAAVRQYGYDFMAQFQPLIDAPGSRNGAFLDACIIHGSTNSSIDGVNNQQAFQQWLNGGQQWYVAKCNNSTSEGPCDPSAICVPFPSA